MKAIISCNYDDKYLWCLPLVTWGWNKIGVDVICFMPQKNAYSNKYYLLFETIISNNLRIGIQYFKSPEHKEATYTQCSRLYGACLDLPEDEVLILSDVDMFLFQIPSHMGNHEVFEVFGHDLVPENQYPMCYISAPVKQWRRAIDHTKTYQNHLDLLLGHIECESFVGNYWGKDQETIFNLLKDSGTKVLNNRAKEGTQFASHRYDRDDSFILDRLSLDTIDYHLNRPGYEPQNFDIILRIMKWHFPNENFDWLINFNEQYKQLL